MFLGVTGVFIRERLGKVCNSSILNFRDKGPFENIPDMHGNISFDPSDPAPGYGLIMKTPHHTFGMP